MRSTEERLAVLPASPRRNKTGVLVSVTASITWPDKQVKNAGFRGFIRTLLGWRVLVLLEVQRG